MHFPARLERERPERQRAIQPHARLAGAQVVALVKAGADLSGTPLSQLDAAGLRTALAAAAEAGQARAVTVLLEAGADPSLPDAQTGKTPLTIAAEKGHQETVAALVKAGADLNAALAAAAEADQARAVTVLLEAGANLNAALAAAAEAGQARAVAALVKAGADPSLPDAQTGKTPLTVAVEKGHQETVAALLEAGADLVAALQSEAAPTTQASLCAAQSGHADTVAALVRDGANPSAAASVGGSRLLLALDLSGQRLSVLPAGVRELRQLRWLSLCDNELAELPIELAELQNLKVLRLGGNPQLQTVAAIAAEKGTTAVFDYLRDLHDDPQPCFKLKVLLAGASMAGKTSMRNRLMGRAKVLAEKDTERTIGLDIAPGVALPDPQGRAPHGILLIVYDAGGHDEYQEMQQVFVTPDALNFLVWDLAKRPAEGQEEQAFQREMVAQQVHWAQIIQSCAPGSTVRSL